MRQLKQYCAE
jgi:hypothetical protein